MPGRNAILLISPDHMAVGDFEHIARRARALAPDVHAFVHVDGRRNRTAKWAQLLRPTLLVETVPVYRGHWRGHLLRCGVGGKLESFARMQAAGLPLPRWTELTPDTRLDAAEWGDYVVVKPSRGRRGAYVWVHRTHRVRYKAPESYPEGHPGRDGPMVVQRFVYTGRWPAAYRVTSFLGEPLHALRYDGSRAQEPLESATDFAGAGGGRSIVAAAVTSQVTQVADADVLALARRIHAVYAQTPLLGIDLMRDARSGELFIAEVNSSYCWILSNESGRRMQQQFGLDFRAQFDGLELAAQALVRATRALAR